MEGDERFKNMTIKNIMKDSFKYSDTRRILFLPHQAP